MYSYSSKAGSHYLSFSVKHIDKEKDSLPVPRSLAIVQYVELPVSCTFYTRSYFSFLSSKEQTYISVQVWIQKVQKRLPSSSSTCTFTQPYLPFHEQEMTVQLDFNWEESHSGDFGTTFPEYTTRYFCSRLCRKILWLRGLFSLRNVYTPFFTCRQCVNYVDYCKLR